MTEGCGTPSRLGTGPRPYYDSYLLPLQVHWGGALNLLPELVAPIEPLDRPRFKPRGGLWTSTHTPADVHLSDWSRWCHDEMPEWLHHRIAWKLQPRAARLIVIDTLADLVSVVRQFPAVDRRYSDRAEHPDWHAIAGAGYDGVHLTEKGQWRTRMSMPENLYGWDCESTLWFRWCFASDPESLREPQPGGAGDGGSAPEGETEGGEPSD